MKKQAKNPVKQKKETPKATPSRKTKVESDTGKRPSGDTSPLPPNPNKVDDHDD